MRTIGYRHHGPKKDHQSSCHYCGDVFLRSELYGPDENGYLACADDRPGRVEKQLDYIRALNASKPTEVRGARDRPGPAPDFTTLVGWAWVQSGSGVAWGGNLQLNKTVWTASAVDPDPSSLYTFSGCNFTTVDAFSFDSNNPANNVPRHYLPLRLNANTAQVRGGNYLMFPDDVTFSPNVGTGGLLVLAYSNTGGEGVLTPVAEAWVNGTTGAIYASDGDVTVARTSTGLYTATLNSGTYQIATVNRFDTGTTLDIFGIVWAGRVSSTVAAIRSVTLLAAPLDADFVIRMFK